jgi:hypothetical protein
MRGQQRVFGPLNQHADKKVQAKAPHKCQNADYLYI